MSSNSSCNVACTALGRSAEPTYGDSELAPRIPAHGKTNQAQLAPRNLAHGKFGQAEDETAHGSQEQEKADQEDTEQRHLHLHQAAQGMAALSSSFGSSSVSTGAVSSA
jgi:hypothetical protein